MGGVAKTYIGIDPGTHTGVAVKRGDEYISLLTTSIHKALDIVSQYADGCRARGEELFIVFEDARQAHYHGRAMHSSARLQGAGSVKRDCSIWEDFCLDKGIQFRATPPMYKYTKLTPESFRMMTGWDKPSSNHSRDAAMLIIGL